jgi:hypothetical protein
MNLNAAFQWECQPQAENLVLSLVKQACQSSPTLSQLEQDLLRQTSTRLFDWVDHVAVPHSDAFLQQLQAVGFVKQGEGVPSVFAHPGAQLPRVVLEPSSAIEVGLAVTVDSIADFLMVHGGSQQPIEGALFGDFRRCQISVEKQMALWVIERRGTLSLQPTRETPQQLHVYRQALEKWMTRPRAEDNEDQAMQQTIELTRELIQLVGQQRAAWTVLEGERRYWQARNRAGQIQKNRQDGLGMGWANHDHHTFRSSRRHFTQLVHVFELLGFHCRERFYAGEEAGWGAQVMENPVCRLVLFLDVDLAPHEIAQDFAHDPLPETEQLGTIGLWCALHGDSILKAGMHHLEAQFMFEDLAHELEKQDVHMMNPFSSFPYLKQAFTVGEKWEVDPKRVRRLVEQGKLTAEQGQHFLLQGAIGSHLENLQRREGYKGFNQKNVSLIIKQTDPRLYESI